MHAFDHRVLPAAALFATLLAGTPLAADPPAGASDQQPEWALVYVMSYDNNLEHCGPIILDGLERGVTKDNVRVLVLHDDKDRAGLKRWVINKEGRSHELLETDNIASEEVVGDFLSWVAKNHVAKRYAVIYLNHGGDLDDMCQDEWTVEGGKKHWLSARKMGPVMREFRKQAKGDVELLFLQQCGRGSIDNLYNFREAADAVMASQFVVGAPNTYYIATVKALCEKPDRSGVELAEKIMRTDQHFTHYVCVDGKQLSALPKMLNPVVEKLVGGEPAPRRALRPCFGGWRRNSETNYDLLGWLKAAAKESELGKKDMAPFEKLEHWVNNDLIVAERSHPRQRRRLRDVCGLSLYVPVSSSARQKYLDYPLRQDSKLGKLWESLYPQGN